MSTMTEARPATRRPAAQDGTTFTRVLTSEWIKFRTLRSSWIVLASAVVAMIVIGAVIGSITGSKWNTQLDAEDRVASAPLQGLLLAQLLIGVLGVLFVSGEYSTGMIRSTLAAVPRRLPVLTAKALVYGLLTLVTLTASSFATFFLAQVFLKHYGHATSISAPTALRVVIATGVYLTLVGLLGSAMGWIVRSTPGGISLLVAVLLVVPGILGALPGQWAADIAKYLPSSAGASFYSTLHTDGTLTPGTGLLVLVIWVVAALGLAGVLLKRRDG